MKIFAEQVRKLLSPALVSIMFFCGGCGKGSHKPQISLDPAAFNETNAFAFTSVVTALGPRISGTPGAAKAAEFIVAKLKIIGLTPDISLFEDETPSGKVKFRNITTTLPGTTEDIIVLVSHYDTKSGIGANFVGANDSGSSTGLLLEMAKMLKSAKRTGPKVMLAFVDGEECSVQYGPTDGLHGSRQLAAQLKKRGLTSKVKGVIVVDMIGDKNLDAMIPMNSSQVLVPLVFEAAREENQRLMFSLYEAVLDDHYSFMVQGMPAVDIIDFKYGSAPGRNDYWHTTADTMDKLSPASLGIVGRVVIRVVNKLSKETK